MQIDLKEVVRSYKPNLLKVPFLVSYLKKIVHQKELNWLLNEYSHLGSIGFIRNSLRDMDITYSAEGLDRLDPKKRYIFSSNHPYGGLDGVMLADIVASYFGDVRVLVNDILMNVTPLQDIFLPINKYGKQNLEYSQMYNDAFDSNMPIITFPSGLVSRRIDGKIRDLPWKHSFVRQAITTERDVVPVYFAGGLSNFFYRLSSIRKKLGIKANIEMIYLPDEMFKQAGDHFVAHFGEPVSWQELKKMKLGKATQMLRKKTYDLGKK